MDFLFFILCDRVIIGKMLIGKRKEKKRKREKVSGTNDVVFNVVQQERSNNKCYASTYIYI